ncbi:MAG: 3-phosphoshikimate 1-carboxyvinyltransferase [Saprospiraceae bacterium]
MMEILELEAGKKNLSGIIELDGSKSISNRVLLIKALSQKDFDIQNLSNSDDTQTFVRLLKQDTEELDAGAAGTTFRFLTAYFAFQKGTQILTGSNRMKQRPIGILVDQLNRLGASISYLEKEGFPPLKIGEGTPNNTSELQIPANISSQYISALMMLAPTLPNGLNIELTGKIVSPSYLELTLGILSDFGIKSQWEGNQIKIPPQNFQPLDYTIEADWSAASYHYSLAALADSADIFLKGLYKNSLQGDSVIAEIMESFGVTTLFEKDGIRILKKEVKTPARFDYDFINCPDIAQTLVVICAAKGVPGTFSGLQTLAIKETDRCQALADELRPLGIEFTGDKKEGVFDLKGKIRFNGIPIFKTYHDHRMAMSLAPLSLLNKIKMEDPAVVSKSYPDFWKDLNKLIE